VVALLVDQASATLAPATGCPVPLVRIWPAMVQTFAGVVGGVGVEGVEGVEGVVGVDEPPLDPHAAHMSAAADRAHATSGERTRNTMDRVPFISSTGV
jgi:hypothetical protein